MKVDRGRQEDGGVFMRAACDWLLRYGEEGGNAGESPHRVKMREVKRGGGSDQPEVPSPQTPPHSLHKLRSAVTQTDSDI